MGSTLTVDNIVGATTAANVNIPNHVVQTVTSVDITGLALANANTAKFMDVALTTKVANSTFNVRFYTALYKEDTGTGNKDTDVCLGLGFKTGSASASSGDYTAISTYAPSRENITFSGSVGRAFYSSDAFYAGGSFSGRYHPIDTIYNEESFSPNLAAGTTIRIAVFAKQDYGNSFTIKLGAATSGMSDSGMTSCINITEVAPS